MVAAALAITLAGAACGGGEPEAFASRLSVGTVLTSLPDGSPMATETSTPGAPSTSAVASSSVPTSEPTPPTEPLPGTAADHGPAAGSQLAVIGVEYDDVLNVREGPGVDQAVVGRLSAVADDVLALGDARTVGGSIWLHISAPEATGWASSRFLGFLGSTDDATADLLAITETPPQAESVHGLGRVIARHFAGSALAPRIRVVDPGAIGFLGEVTVDVVGLEDDAIAGFRLKVFTTQLDEPEGYQLRTVERTLICARGLSGGDCI